MSERNCRIIIVDDESDLALNLRDILQDKGYETVVAHDGAAALCLCRDGDFDLGLVDISLPDMAGESLIQSIAEIRPGMEFIIVTGRGTLASAAYAVSKKNIIAYEIKPLEVERLVLLIDQIFKRRRSENDLRKSDACFRAVLENSRSGVIFLSSERRILYASSAYKELLGYTPEELMGQSSAEYVDSEDRDMTTLKFRELLQSPGVTIRFECRLRHKDGTPTWIETTATNLLDDPHVQAIVLNHRDINDRKLGDDALRQSEERIQRKLQSILSPVADIGTLELEDMIDVEAIQHLMDEFFALTRVPNAVIDLKGKVLVGTGWQDVCTKFHRLHPETLANCIECDTVLSKDVQQGTFKTYLCKNHMWDCVTPLIIGGQHVGNLFTGQFFFEGEKPDDSVFLAQAAKYGFDEEDYMAAVKRAPVWDRATINIAFEFYVTLANMITSLSHGNIELARMLEERKRSEDALRNSAHRLSLAVHSGQIGIWDWDIENNELLWDDSMYSLYGIRKEDFGGAFEAWSSMLHPDDRKYTEGEIQAAIRGEREYTPEFRIVKPDGGIRCIRSASQTIRDKDGKAVRMIGTNIDITERKQAEEKIRENDILFRKLSANVSDLIYQFTRKPDGTYFVPIASEGIKNIFGCSPEDVLEDFAPIGRVIFPEDAARVIADIEYSAKHMTFFTCEFRVQIPGKPIQWIYSKSTPEKLADGSVTWYGFNADVTELKMTEEALLNEKQRLSSIVDGTQAGTWEWNVQTGEAIFNEQWAGIIGYTLEELSPVSIETWMKYSDPDDLQKSGELLASHFRGELKQYDFESRMKHKDGYWVWVLDRGKVASWTEDGKPLWMFGTHQDITERKKVEEEINRLNASLEQRVIDRTAQLAAANNELEAFSYTVSHDLRAPLRHIDGYVNLLVSRCSDNLNEKGLHYLDTIADSAHQMGILIDDLLQFSRTGRGEMQWASVDMNQALQEAQTLLQEGYEGRNIEWVIADVPSVHGDYTLLRQVWINLLDNAIKYTRTRKAARVEISTREESGEIIFSVADNGVGFDMQYAGKLFGVFQRLHSLAEFQGTGIGLATVQRIILRHGGRVWAEAELNQGATFYFALPALKEISHG